MKPFNSIHPSMEDEKANSDDSLQNSSCSIPEKNLFHYIKNLKWEKLHYSNSHLCSRLDKTCPDTKMNAFLSYYPSFKNYPNLYSYKEDEEAANKELRSALSTEEQISLVLTNIHTGANLPSLHVSFLLSKNDTISKIDGSYASILTNGGSVKIAAAELLKLIEGFNSKLPNTKKLYSIVVSAEIKNFHPQNNAAAKTMAEIKNFHTHSISKSPQAQPTPRYNKNTNNQIRSTDKCMPESHPGNFEKETLKTKPCNSIHPSMEDEKENSDESLQNSYCSIPEKNLFHYIKNLKWEKLRYSNSHLCSRLDKTCPDTKMNAFLSYYPSFKNYPSLYSYKKDEEAANKELRSALSTEEQISLVLTNIHTGVNFPYLSVSFLLSKNDTISKIDGDHMTTDGRFVKISAAKLLKRIEGLNSKLPNTKKLYSIVVSAEKKNSHTNSISKSSQTKPTMEKKRHPSLQRKNHYHSPGHKKNTNNQMQSTDKWMPRSHPGNNKNINFFSINKHSVNAKNSRNKKVKAEEYLPIENVRNEDTGGLDQNILNEMDCVATIEARKKFTLY